MISDQVIGQGHWSLVIRSLVIGDQCNFWQLWVIFLFQFELFSEQFLQFCGFLGSLGAIWGQFLAIVGSLRAILRSREAREAKNIEKPIVFQGFLTPWIATSSVWIADPSRVSND